MSSFIASNVIEILSFPNLGASAGSGKGVIYTVWAPEHQEVYVEIKGKPKIKLREIGQGYFQGNDDSGQAGDLYTFTVDEDQNIPDFASCYQPYGVMGPSEVINHLNYQWQTTSWVRPSWRGGQVLYELHIGTFTEEGTYTAAVNKLDHLVHLGVTTVELMPLAEWAGERNWGYDGVMLFAPYHLYGRPDELRALVDACHSRGLAVVLDVVFNHLGPIGNHSHRYSKYYFHEDRNTPWGRNYNLDGPSSSSVRAFLLQNLKYWLDEFRFDGFRMDATHAVHDESPKHFLAEATNFVHESGGFIIAEDERNWAGILTPTSLGGLGFDAVWADDFCHSIRTSQRHHDEVFSHAFIGDTRELATILENGWLYQGQLFPATGEKRGTPCHLHHPAEFIYCITNHDQAGNRIGGEYLHQLISNERYRAVSLLFLLSPYTPLIFMGQEWGAKNKFQFFTDFPGELGSKIHTYRKSELAKIYRFAHPMAVETMPDPQALGTFLNSKLRWEELRQNESLETLDLYQKGLQLRRELFGLENPDRDMWSIHATEDSISIIYNCSERKIKVVFYPEKSPLLRNMGSEITLLYSSQFPEVQEQTAATHVFEIL